MATSQVTMFQVETSQRLGLLRLGWAGGQSAAGSTDLDKYPWEVVAWGKPLGKYQTSLKLTSLYNTINLPPQHRSNYPPSLLQTLGRSN